MDENKLREKILLTNYMIKDYTGSELDVCAVGSELVRMGYQVVAANYNFSGRGFDRKLSAMELVMDIIKGYIPALSYLDLFQQIGRERYDLRTNLRRLLETIDSLPPIDRDTLVKKYGK